MLQAIGLTSADELYAHLPREAVLDRPLALESGKSEYEIVDYFRTLGERNTKFAASFLGAGVYAHYRPCLVDVVVSRGEFLTSYTPYQAEITQGTLTTIFEFQTMVCQLTGMDVANASMYDGSTAVPEAALMAMRITGREGIVAARGVHPEYREVLRTNARNQSMAVAECGYDASTGKCDLAEMEALVSDRTAAVIVQSPNFFGSIEDVKAIAELAHRHGALLVVAFAEAVSLGLLEPPREADIVCGELQSFAITPSYGGPFAGVIACKEKYLRQMPGRLVGETKDANGNRAFCLTLSTREQHIRREKATSNICTNQALIALMATVFMTVYGKQGLRELAEQNLAKAHYLASRLKRHFTAPFFNEFTARPARGTAAEAHARLAERGSLGGLDLGRFYPELDGTLLLCATEMAKKEHLDAAAEVMGQ
jgi:glycine dehydrogenase subunit 1